MIEQATIERIFDAANIVEVVGDFVHLKKRGTNHIGLCPFHHEKTPSFSVSLSKGIYKCFGCGKGGNPVNFIMEHEHFSYTEALKYLAKKYNIEILEKQETAEDIERRNETESLQIVSAYAQRFFSNQLHNHNEGIAIGLSYFKERGFREQVIEKFQLGYSPEERDAFTKDAQKNGYRIDYLTKTGLTIQNDFGAFDRFSARVMFPIHSLAGKVIGFGGRTLKKDKTVAKYLNSPESEIYHKSKVLYGLYHAKNAIIQNDKCFLVEGYTDVISMHQSGIENVVASSGTSLTTDQIRLIKRFTNNLCILYDGDAAGIKASIRGIDMVLEEGLNVKVLLLPDGEDPDSFAQKNNTADFKLFIEKNESDFITFKTKLLYNDAKNDPIKKSELLNDIVRSISIIPDAITRSVYIKECSTILGVDERILYAESNKKRKKEFESKYKTVENEFSIISEKSIPKNLSIFEKNDCDTHEKEIIRILLNYANKEVFTHQVENELGDIEEWYETVLEHIVTELEKDELEFINPLYNAVLNEFKKGFHDNIPIDEKFFIVNQNQQISKLAVDLLCGSYPLSKIWKKREVYIQTEDMILKELVKEVIFAYKLERIKIYEKETQQELKLAQESKNLDDITKLQEKIIILTNLKKTIAASLGNRAI